MPSASAETACLPQCRNRVLVADRDLRQRLVPLLVGLVVLGHLVSGLRERRCSLLGMPSPVRAGAYAGAVVLLVAFGPGAVKAFIYFQF